MSVRSFYAGITAAVLLGVSVVHATSDLNTPIGTLRTYYAALRAQSVEQAMACFTSMGKREGAVAKSILTFRVATEHLSKIAVAKLGPPTSRNGKDLASACTGYNAMRAKLKKARVRVHGGEAIIQMPGSTAGENGKLYFLKKAGADWKIDGGKLFHLAAVKKIPANALVPLLQIEYRMVGVFNAAVGDIQTGKVKTWKQLHKDLNLKMMAAFGSRA
jgi:hypothetical protein